MCEFAWSDARNLLRGCFVAMALLVALARPAWPVPACPGFVQGTQPDGTVFEFALRGDEHAHWHEDRAGYAIMRRPDTGAWVYARETNGVLTPTAHRVGRADPRALGLARPDIKRLQAQSAGIRDTARATTSGISTAPITSGTMRNLVVLVNFSDLAVAYPTTQYDALFNQVGYTYDGAVGSVQDYYHQISNSQLTVQSTVVEPVTLDNGYVYYGQNDSYGYDLRPREMVAHALAKLEARGFDFTSVDGNGDGWVDGLTIIHAGGGEEYGGNNANYIWSHQWALASPAVYDGVSMQIYHTEPARRGWDSSPSSQGITRIGVICHETGHFLGLPDLYDYGYDSEGAGKFCLMAGGSWNGSYGTSPAHMSAWCKVAMGWITPNVITATGTYNLAQIETAHTCLKLQGNFPGNEFFLIENRQGVNFDAALPGTQRGVLIWHIDQSRTNNNDQTHYLVDLEEASGTQHLALNQNAGDDADYFRAGNATSFTNATTPNNLSYTGTALNAGVTNVGATGATMSVTITFANQAPTAADDAYAMAPETPLTVPAPGVLGNDSDVDGNPLTAAKASDPAHGAVTLNADGAFTYTPAPGFTGVDSFTYTASDGNLTSNAATVTITVEAPGWEGDCAPRPDGSGTLSIIDWTQVGRLVVGLDTVASGGEFRRADCAPRDVTPGDGILERGDGALTVADWVQAGRYAVALDPPTEAGGPSEPGAVAPIQPRWHAPCQWHEMYGDAMETEVAQNSPPLASDGSYKGHSNIPLIGLLTATDANGDSLTFSVLDGTKHGCISIIDPKTGVFVYLPSLDYSGADQFTFTAIDDRMVSNTATVTIDIVVP